MASKTAGYHESSSSMQARLEEESAPVEAKRRDEVTVSDNDPTGVSDNESSDDCSVFTATTLTLIDDETAA